MSNLWKYKKSIFIILLLGILLFMVLISKDKIVKIISSNIEWKPKSDIENTVKEIQTEINYEVKEVNGELLSILIQIEDKRGIETIQTEDIILNCNGREKISLDRTINENGIYQFKYKISGLEEELCKILRPVTNIVINTLIAIFFIISLLSNFLMWINA